jgi:hypothetical protein
MAGAEGVAVIVAVGFMVTVSKAVAVHPLAEPVIVYVAVPVIVLLLLVNVWAMLLPEPALPPLIPALSATVHVYVAPAAVLLSAILVVPPLHIAELEGVPEITGIGLMVTTAVVLPVHVLAVPIIV